MIFTLLGLLFVLAGSRCTPDDPSLDTSLPVDTVNLKTPRIVPAGGNFHVKTDVQLVTDTLPAGAVIEYSLDKGQTWQVGQQFTLIKGGQVMARLRADNRVSLTRSASFRLYFERMLIIGNSITSHPPVASIGWFNSNGMAASAPEKDYVHLLTANLETLYKPLLVRLQNGGDFELKFGAPDYTRAEFAPVINDFKPDLIVVRLGENMDENRVQPYDLETQYRTLLAELSSTSQPHKIICTTSVWARPKADAVIRKVTTEKGYVLVDLSGMVGQSRYFAGQYSNPAVAAHPNDVGMQQIADLIWEKFNN
ncbi:SGNH/GDSL hydrolase family protein [Spirosoma validum]|uniref:SGNH/GDSL hydrolase family protein n=1 Tax=Spirosoma validum TaxID=2771355 RepID=UPI001CC31829|nr:SGNH/GDSL hydrolase family protein [Spirosoma validum]